MNHITRSVEITTPSYCSQILPTYRTFNNVSNKIFMLFLQHFPEIVTILQLPPSLLPPTGDICLETSW